MPPRSSPSITSTTKRAKCLSGSHSSNDGGRRNAVRRSKSRKLLIAIKPPFGANQWRDSSENQRRWVKSDRLLGPQANSRSICHTDDAAAAAQRWEEFCKTPGPMVVGATQGASCFGPAYEYALTAATDLRRRKIRDRAPITFVTSEPYIGHLGLGGVGDTKGMLESILRDRDIKWITNAKVDRIEPDAVEVTEVNEDGSVKKAHKLASK